MDTGPDLNSDRAHTGYSLEEKYFNELEIRRRMEAAEQTMYCPQCGADHLPTKLLGVDATECAQCHGIFVNEKNAKALREMSAGQLSS